MVGAAATLSSGRPNVASMPAAVGRWGSDPWFHRGLRGGLRGLGSSDHPPRPPRRSDPPCTPGYCRARVRNSPRISATVRAAARVTTRTTVRATARTVVE
eukprot:scaffold100377_cov20-Phaeocystis_antarctica.AAC.1